MIDKNQYYKQYIVKISNIIIDDEYFSFRYVILVSNKTDSIELIDSIYESDHSRKDDKEEFKQEIINGWGHQLALEQIFK